VVEVGVVHVDFIWPETQGRTCRRTSVGQ